MQAAASNSKNIEEDGELTKRLKNGFRKVVENVSNESLSIELFERSLPPGVDPVEIRNVIVDTFKENALEVFKDVCDAHDVLERLAVAESLMGPVIKGKRYPAPAKQMPSESVANIIIEKKLALKKALEEEAAKVEAQIEVKKTLVDKSRKRAKHNLELLDQLQNRINVNEEDADTEPDD